MRITKPSLVIIGVVVICTIGTFLLIYSTTQQTRRIEQARDELLMISNAVENYRDEWGMYPEEGQSATEILLNLSTPVRGGGPLLLNLWQGKNETPRDPWGREYCMESGNWNTPPRFYSVGPNGIDERMEIGSDDVRITRKTKPNKPQMATPRKPSD